MPSARVELPNGSIVTIEGHAEEIVRITQLLTGTAKTEVTPAKKARRRETAASQKPKGITDHVRALKTEGFFKAGKSLEDVREALESAGYIHAPNEISPVLLRLRRAGEIGRVRKDDVWVYTHRD